MQGFTRYPTHYPAPEPPHRTPVGLIIAAVVLIGLGGGYVGYRIITGTLAARHQATPTTAPTTTQPVQPAPSGTATPAPEPTAVGMVDDVRIMIAAVIASVLLMMLFAGPIGRFVSDHPTIKMLALAFLVVVGVVLVAEGFEHHVPKGYVYFAMAFSVAVEMLNIRMRKKSAKAVELHPPRMPGA